MMTWQDFVFAAKYQARYTLLSEAGVDDLGLRVAEALEGMLHVVQASNLVKDVRVGTRYWRARTTLDESGVAYQNVELGPVPPTSSTTNRLSPAGISMFYGSTNRATAITEIWTRKPRRFVTVAAYELVRPIPVVDLRGVQHGSLGEDRLDKSAFLCDFVADLHKPIELDGREHLEYVPTQVVTEYLRRRAERYLEGVLYDSAQSLSGSNCALFIGPEECADPGFEADHTILRYLPESKETIDLASP